MCVSYSSGNVTYNSVLEVLGASDPAKIARLADAVASGDVDGALSEVAAMCDLGKSMPILASDLSSFFRNVLYKFVEFLGLVYMKIDEIVVAIRGGHF